MLRQATALASISGPQASLAQPDESRASVNSASKIFATPNSRLDKLQSKIRSLRPRSTNLGAFHGFCNAQENPRGVEEKRMTTNGSQKTKSPSQLIDGRIKELGDWRGRMLSRLRTLVKEADPEVVEEWKWRGVPVWSHDGLICTGETYKAVVKMTFAKGAALKDPSGLFNASLEGSTRRAIDFREGEKINEKALKTLVRAAVTLNKSRAKS